MGINTYALFAQILVGLINGAFYALMSLGLSIIFGLLGLAVFLNTFHLPRSAPLVGGMTLALMTMPVIVIAARNARASVLTGHRS